MLTSGDEPPATSPTAVRESAPVTTKALEQSGGHVGRAEADQFAVRIDMLAAAGREAAGGDDAAGKTHHQHAGRAQQHVIHAVQAHRQAERRQAGTSPTTAMPMPGKSKAQDAAQAPTTSRMGPGQLGRQRLTAISSRQEPSPSPSVGMRISGRRRDSSRKGWIKPLLRSPAGQAAELRQRQRDRHARHVADQHGPRQQVGQYAQPQHPRDQAAHAHGQRDAGGRHQPVLRIGQRHAGQRGGDQGAGGGVGPTIRVRDDPNTA